MPGETGYKVTCGGLLWTGIAAGYGLDNQMIGVWFPAGVGNFSLRHHIQTGSGAYPAS